MLLVQDRQRSLLDLGRELVKLRIESLAQRLEELCPRIVRAIDAVSETHEPDLLRAGLADPVLSVVRGADLLQLVHHGRWRAAVRGSLQGADRADQARSEVGVRGCDHARGKG